MRRLALAASVLLLASGASAQPGAFTPPVPQLPTNVNNEAVTNLTAGAELLPLARWGYGYARAVGITENGTGVTMQGSVFQTLDLSNVNALSVVGELEFPGVISDLATQGNLVYVMLTHFLNTETGMFIIDVTDPAAPTLRGAVTGLAATSIAVLDDHAYIGTYNTAEGPDLSLRVISIADTDAPVQVAALTTPSFPDDIAFHDGRAYLALNSAGLGIVDISAPANPSLGASPITSYVGAVGVSDAGVLAVGRCSSAPPSTGGSCPTNSAALSLHDLSDPDSPAELGSVGFDIATNTLGLNPVDIVWDRDQVLMASLFGALKFIDASDPAAPTVVRSRSTARASSASGTNRLAIQGDKFLVSDFYSGVFQGLASQRRVRGFLKTAGIALNLVVDDETDVIYAADAGAGVVALERVAPAGEKERLELTGQAHTSQWNYTTDVALQVNHVYAADGFSGIWAIDKFTMTTTANVLRGTPIRTVSVTEDGRLLLALDDAQVVHVLSLDNPAVPVEVATITPPAGAADVGGTGPVIWVADVNDTRMRLYDMSTPSAPQALSSLDLRGSRFRFAREGDRLYANGAGGFITVVDVSDPASATVEGAFDVVGSAQVPLAGDGDVLIVAGNGVYAYRVTDVPSTPPFPRLSPLAFSEQIGDVVTGVVFVEEGVAALSVGHAGVITFATPVPTSGTPRLPLAGELSVSVAPNPSRGAVTVDITSPEAADVAIYDMLGRRVRTLATTASPASPEALAWDGRSDAGTPLASGVYVVRAQTASGAVATARVTIVR